MDDYATFTAYLPFILKGIPVTLLVAFLAMCVAIPVALILALGMYYACLFNTTDAADDHLDL